MGAFESVEHIVVLMLENRSFDHVLGYLRCRHGRQDVDGLTGQETNHFEGVTFRPQPLRHTRFGDEPRHGWASIHRQIAGGMAGFVTEFVPRAKAQNIGDVMGYYDERTVSVYHHLVENYLVCDRWFASVPGPTWPNRLYALCGTSGGLKDNPDIRLTHIPRLGLKTVFEYLADARVAYDYVYDNAVPFLWAFERHREARTGLRFGEFAKRVAAGRLAPVTWIDPDFYNLSDRGGVTGTPNDDHPPADLRSGQELVGRVYNMLLKAPGDLWSRTLFVVTYDEHGGFYDHVDPEGPGIPRPADTSDDFRHYGVRVPAMVVSPWVPARSVTHSVLDHTSILKTILRRFCHGASMGPRVDHAADLWGLLCLPQPRADRPAATVPDLVDFGVGPLGGNLANEPAPLAKGSAFEIDDDDTRLGLAVIGQAVNGATPCVNLVEQQRVALRNSLPGAPKPVPA